MNLTIIQNKIYEIRGHKVMLDFDLAMLYEVETKALNQAVKRNMDRFPEDFMFRLSKEEWEKMRSQIVTASIKSKAERSTEVASFQKKRNIAAFPFVFTEHGVTMLASVLHSKRAVSMPARPPGWPGQTGRCQSDGNIAIVRAFIDLRQIVVQHKDLAEKLEELKTEVYERIGEHDSQLNAIYNAIENILDEKAATKSWIERERIGFKK
jgi:ORF6N domain